MSKSLVLRSPSSLDSDVMPLMLSDGIHIAAENAYTDQTDSLVKVADYMQPSIIYTSPAIAKNPGIITDDAGFVGLVFSGAQGLLVNPFASLAGYGEVTFYLVGKFIAGTANDIYFKWGPVQSANSNDNKSVLLRRYASNNELQFTYDPGKPVNVATVHVPRPSTETAIVSCGYSVASKEVFVGFNGDEVITAMPQVSQALISEATGDFTLGYNYYRAGQESEMTLNRMHAFRQYHSAAQRAKVVAALASAFGIDI
ncbi:hypothetical protein D9K64_06230 [Klebsiella pneumoniae]|nr:hypothetical protein D9K64_06230 [Klebsiella pneumoniae]